MGDGFWTQVSTMGINQIIWMNDTLYAARNPLYQRNGGVYRSIDGGINWDIPNKMPLGDGYSVRVYSKSNPLIYGASGAFTIIGGKTVE